MHGNFCLFLIILLAVDLLSCAHLYAGRYQIANIFGTDAPMCEGLSALLREMGQKSQMHHHNDGMFFKTYQIDEFHQIDCIDSLVLISPMTPPTFSQLKKVR
ncbi:hypothetical protein T07_3424 [Trichinella nelsoni]|uniref:Uncharacterized protein n=1 Tax=Trichinella nelsoni TaxID=6336 RepID=A0A0V0RJC4_9BILA|nr:hypothetical protein T07_3424 [Trichinella nelsoni]